MNNVLTLILAGGKGTRLEPLTRDRAKPAVPFGGAYRIIDFVFSNCLNSGLRKILVLTQYKAMSLDRHINLAWKLYFVRELGEYAEILPPQQRIDESWYQGTADAVYQNIYSIEKENPKYVLILAGDHIYKMNYRHMIAFHEDQQADLTVGALRVPRSSAHHFGVMQIDAESRIIGFQEKPANPEPIPDDPQYSLASMGIYVFSARFLFEQLCRDATIPSSHHDFGKDILPHAVEHHRVLAFPFRDENRKGDAYWRDVGTIDSYYEANMDLVSTDPQLNLYDTDWPIRTLQPNLPPPKFVFGSYDDGPRRGHALDSIVCVGSIISGGKVERSILGPSVRIHSYSHVQESILCDGVEIGRGARIRRAIIDKRVVIPPNSAIGFDPAIDAARGLTISPGGIVVLGKSDSSKLLANPQTASHPTRLDADAPSQIGPRMEKFRRHRVKEAVDSPWDDDRR